MLDLLPRLITSYFSGDYYLDGSSKEVDRLTLTRSIYDETYGQWDGTSFTAPTEGLYEFTIRMVGISSGTSGPPIILPQLNGFLIDKWFCKVYGNADCQKTFQGKKYNRTKHQWDCLKEIRVIGKDSWDKREIGKFLFKFDRT